MRLSVFSYRTRNPATLVGVFPDWTSIIWVRTFSVGAFDSHLQSHRQPSLNIQSVESRPHSCGEGPPLSKCNNVRDFSRRLRDGHCQSQKLTALVQRCVLGVPAPPALRFRVRNLRSQFVQFNGAYCTCGQIRRHRGLLRRLVCLKGKIHAVCSPCQSEESRGIRPYLYPVSNRALWSIYQQVMSDQRSSPLFLRRLSSCSSFCQCYELPCGTLSFAKGGT
ncbi:hypothetical protein BC834DRAFT_373557 [Gloeopeniophorella convolvens]|nr:hypothetical protein BC834DRAFT_373557 [Gloeopeniophorella convolvens]